MSLARPWRKQEFPVRRSDGLVALALAVPVVGSLVVDAARHNHPAVVLLALGALAAILLRRSRPAMALLLAVAVEAVLPNNRTLLLPVMAVLYTIAEHTPWRTAAAAGSGAAVVAIIAGAVSGSGVTGDHGGLLGYAIGAAASCAAAVAAGLYVGARSRVVEGLRERAERLDREQELLADRAVARERVRIAQELHDIVAHNVSLIVVQAQALGTSVDDERVAHSAGAIAELGRQAMTEMHTTLKLLRDQDGDTPELTPQPGLGQLERLLDQSRRAGLEIELIVEGQPRELARGVDLSAFRIVQEALTNVVKHAASARTEVTLAYGARALELTILDTGDELPAALRAQAPAGHGVIGMRERATVFGGSLRTEALPRGFKVTATLPYTAATT
jgi:signal transduction histidine kinase